MFRLIQIALLTSVAGIGSLIAQTTVNVASSTAASANSNRNRLIVKNLGTTVLYVLYGTGTASATNFTFCLAAGAANNDGSSQPITDTMWRGAVQWASSADGGLAILREF